MIVYLKLILREYLLIRKRNIVKYIYWKSTYRIHSFEKYVFTLQNVSFRNVIYKSYILLLKRTNLKLQEKSNLDSKTKLKITEE